MKLDESDIIEFMKTGRNEELDDKYVAILQEELELFAEGVYQRLISAGYNINTTPIVFVGGGATVMKLFGKRNQKKIKFIEDIHANAKGFEFLGKIILMNRKG